MEYRGNRRGSIRKEQCSSSQLNSGKRGRGKGGGEGGRGKGDQCSSFLLVNIARLITQTGRSKSGFLSDQAEANNCLFVGVTETWLTDGVLDSEVSHDFPGYSHQV
jgi:hypothetical protein